MRTSFLSVLPAVLLCVVPATVLAKTSNGNDLALEYSTASTPNLADEIKAAAMGRPHFFRYLRIIKLENGEKDGRPYVAIVALEPSSYMNVQFVIKKPVSLKRLRDDPETKLGDAIAVTGRMAGLDKKHNLIVLNPVIVKYKDRLSPKVGKELLYEVDPTAIYYMYTGAGKDRVVKLSGRDKDLLPWHGMTFPSPEARDAYADKIIKQYGKKGWADYLLGGIAKREKERKAAAGSSRK